MVVELGDLGQDTRRSARDLEPVLGQLDLPPDPLHQDRAEAGLQILDLNRQGRLADRTFLGRPAEMPMSGQGREIAKLTQSGHLDRTFLSA